jgi:hypothetical protein
LTSKFRTRVVGESSQVQDVIHFIGIAAGFEEMCEKLAFHNIKTALLVKNAY